MKKNLSLLILLIGLAGCATSPVSTVGADFVPESRIYDTQYFTKKENTFSLTIKRDVGIWCMGVSSPIFINSLHIADIKAGEKLVLYLPKDEYILGANGCAAGLHESNVIMDRDRIFRIGFGSGMDFILAPTAD